MIKKVIIDKNDSIYCYNLDQNGKCAAFNFMNCSKDCSARIGSLRQLLKLYKSLVYRSDEAPYYRTKVQEIKRILAAEEGKQIQAAYLEDKHRGSKGGSSDSDSNSRASIKQKMKDNRPVECKLSASKREEIKAAMEEWEAENGRLPRLSRSILSRGTKEEK